MSIFTQHLLGYCPNMGLGYLLKQQKLFVRVCMLFVLMFAGAGLQLKAQLNLSASPYNQDFNTLVSTGTSSTVPTGWFFNESGTNANTTYTAGIGSSNTADTYSFGASGNSERAFGGLLSGSLTPLIGAGFKNTTGNVISSITITYTGEQWRLGVNGRADRLDFQYSFNATSITSGTWVDQNDLDFSSPNTGATAGALDGNANLNKTSKTYTFSGLSLANNATFFVRWADLDVTGADDGLSVDDFSLSFTTPAPPPTNVGINSSFAIVNFGGSDVFYDLKATTGNPDFNNANLGTFNSSQPLFLDGAQNNVFKCSGGDITGTNLLYRIYPVSAAPPVFSSIGINASVTGFNNGCGGQDQTWETSNAGINLISGRCDGEYFIEVYTTASSNGGVLTADNSGANFKARFTINNSANSGIYESYIVFNKNSTGNTYYDLNASTSNADFIAGLGTLCSNETLILAGGENKVFKCGLNNIINGNLFYRIYPAGAPAGTYTAVNLGTATNIGGAGVGCQNQQWVGTNNGTDILNGLTPGNYTIEVYSQADYNLGSGPACGSVYASNNSNNYKANFTIISPVVFTGKPAATLNATSGAACNATVNYNFTTTGTAPVSLSFTLSGATTGSGSGTGSGSLFNVGITLVTVTGSNACTPNAVYSFNVVVTDATPPTVLTNNVTVFLDADGNASITAAQINNGSTDACGIASLSVSPSAFNCSNILPTLNDLIISEYVEGSSNNKAIEIYNGTNALVNLADYKIEVFSNGSTSSSSISLTGSIAPGGVFVIANPSANASILSKANQTSFTISFNGDDAVTLTKGTSFIDVIGRVGNDPGIEWTDGGSYSTLDATLRRNLSVTTGVSVSPTGTGPGAFTTLTTEWTAFATDIVNGLGAHGNTVVLTVTDNKGNTASGNATVIVKDNLAPVAPTLTTITGECNATVIAPIALDNCSGAVAGTTIDPTTYTTQGTYIVNWVFDDGNGNTSTAIQTVTVDDITPSTIVCPANIILSACTETASWTTPVANDNCSGVTVAQTAGPASGSTFANGSNTTITYTATDAGGNQTSCSFTVSRDAVLAASSSSTPILCNGGSSTVTVSATGGTGAYTGTGTFTVTAGTYNYTVTDANGCSTSTSITVEEPTALAASSSSTPILCNGGSSTVTVSATGGTGAYTGTGTFTVTSGTYNYTVTDANGCLTSTSITVEEPTALAASSSSTAILCNGGSSTVTVSATGGTGSYTGTGTFTVTAGTYNYTVTDANGCSTSTSITVGEPTLLTASLASQVNVLCFGGATGSVVITPSGGTSPYNITPAQTGLTAGVKTFTVTDANNCSTTVNATITQPATALAVTCSRSKDWLYYGLAGDQTATITAVASGGTAPYKIEIAMSRPLICNFNGGSEVWSTVAANTFSNSFATCSTSAGMNPVSVSNAIISSGGSYSVNVTLMAFASFTVTVTDANGCVSTCTINMNAEDVRCFNGAGKVKVKICHKTGNGCKEICVDDNAVAAHLAHGDFLGTCTSNCEAPPTLFVADEPELYVEPVADADMPFNVVVLGNPSTSNFKLVVQSESKEPVQIKLFDVLGNVVANLSKQNRNTLITFGDQLRGGTFFAEVMQGKNRKVVKLIKLN